MDDDRTRLDLEHEAAVGARVDEGGAAQAAHRADDREVVAAAVAAERAGLEDQGVAPAVGETRLEDRARRPRRSAASRGPSTISTFARGLRTW